MKQMQTLILELSDLNALKMGESRQVQLTNGGILEILYDKPRKSRWGNNGQPMIKDQILEILKSSNTPLRVTEIGKLLPNTANSTISTFLRRFEKSGIVKHVGMRWKISANGGFKK